MLYKSFVIIHALIILLIQCDDLFNNMWTSHEMQSILSVRYFVCNIDGAASIAFLCHYSYVKHDPSSPLPRRGVSTCTSFPHYPLGPLCIRRPDSDLSKAVADTLPPLSAPPITCPPRLPIFPSRLCGRARQQTPANPSRYLDVHNFPFPHPHPDLTTIMIMGRLPADIGPPLAMPAHLALPSRLVASTPLSSGVGSPTETHKSCLRRVRWPGARRSVHLCSCISCVASYPYVN